MIHDRGDIRSAMLIGFDDATRSHQVSVSCTTLDGDRTAGFLLVVATDSSGKFSVRPRDRAKVEVLSDSQGWVYEAEVLENDSSTFAVSAADVDGIAIAQSLAGHSGSAGITVSAGDISVELGVGPDGSSESARQFLEVCGDR